ncbi:MAG: aminoacyl-tRNA hydrolase [Clostridia bacterium]|nr:aminoacyl-tRNA hydrolase [Clostridia bacterium]
MKIVVGLGNFGKQYENTNHNAGFMVVDRVLDHFNISKSKDMCDGKVYEGNINGEKVYFVKPTTFMNNSGICVMSVLSKLGAKLEDLLVVVDDIDIDGGTVRLKPKGSAGTHNGLRSIVSLVGENFARLKVGVGKPKEHQQLYDFVLAKMGTGEEQKIALEKATQAVIEYVQGESLEKIMQHYNG